ncbi:hypothetical protein SARC_00001 [Sphaeroforma arctica JP610]|uniref:ATP-dependent RNA helicase n=1 Tax=Sphaeroforma arctica JP610 TaxID=667725 RepID=A0A0L0GG99_9EUKA|nr:hypothetical protein SARC_00001 [Sphaeroforma arctica JP610]KNC87866.1 hypothetical protein SARC_00001 [Sphaeroforma arctica JP610]|eukprot:XP_014161768.1 hypothetical protein SARC_00001 [Sphaeroforma arctica JP610]
MPNADNDDDGLVLNLGSNIDQGPLYRDNGMPYHPRRNPRAKSKKMQKAPKKFAPVVFSVRPAANHNARSKNITKGHSNKNKDAKGKTPTLAAAEAAGITSIVTGDGDKATSHDANDRANANATDRAAQKGSRTEEKTEGSESAEQGKKRVQTEGQGSGSVAKKAKTEISSSSAPRGQEHISSLFSYNPEMPESLSQHNQDDTPLGEDDEDVTDLPSSHANNVFHDAKTFEALGVGSRLVRCMSERLGLLQPTTVQSAVIPLALSGRDVLAQSETGSGKTMAFLLPIVEILSSFETRVQRSDGIQALIISPTRELCLQILDVLETLLHPVHWIVPGHVIGGEKKKSEKARIRKGINVLVATPGRLVDHLSTTSSLNVSRCRMLVLDEADRLMELGFKKDLVTIINALNGYHPNFLEADSVGADRNAEGILKPKVVRDRFIAGKTIRRQNVLVSATLNSNVRLLAELALDNPARVVLQGDHGSDTVALAAADEETSASEGVPVVTEQMAKEALETIPETLNATAGDEENDASNSEDERVVDFMSDDEDEEKQESSVVEEAEAKGDEPVEVDVKDVDEIEEVAEADEGQGMDLDGDMDTTAPANIDTDTVEVERPYVWGGPEGEKTSEGGEKTEEAGDKIVDTPQPADAVVPAPFVPTGGNAATQFKTPAKLHQKYIAVPSKLRLVTLAALLRGECTDVKGNPTSKAIVFMSTCDLVDFVYEVFHARSTWGNKDKQGDTDAESPLFGRLHFVRLHGNMKQQERTQAFKKFSKAPTGVMICTDVAARGLDLPFVKWIIQYTIPAEVSDYVHRIGRTARLGESGSAAVFVTPGEADFIKVLEQQGMNVHSIEMNDVLGSLEKVTTVAFREKVIRQNGGKRGKAKELSNVVQSKATLLQMEIEEQVKATEDMRWLARNAFRSYLRGYMTYPKSMKAFMHIKNLHQGHVAKSFGMREAPSDVLKFNKHKPGGKKESQKDKQDAREKKQREKNTKTGGGPSQSTYKPRNIGDFNFTPDANPSKDFKGNPSHASGINRSSGSSKGNSVKGKDAGDGKGSMKGKGKGSDKAVRADRNVGGQNNKSSRGETTVKNYARASGYQSRVPLGMNGIDRSKYSRAPIGG